MWDMFLKIGFFGFNDELVRNNVEFEKYFICKDCYEMNKYFFGVSVILIELVEDIIKGDIIWFLYWNFWYEVVVFKKDEKE